MKFIKNKKGFTLFEGLAAGMVFTVLAAATINQYSEHVTGAQVNAIATTLEQAQSIMLTNIELNASKNTSTVICPIIVLKDAYGAITNTTAGLTTLTYTYNVTAAGGSELVQELQSNTAVFIYIENSTTAETDCKDAADNFTDVNGDVKTAHYELDADGGTAADEFVRWWVAPHH